MTEPPPLEAAQKLLIGASIGSCTCNTKSPELIWHAPNCRYVAIMTALENVEIAISAATEMQGPPHWKTWNGAVLDAGERQVSVEPMTREDALKIWAEHNRRDAHWESHRGADFIDTLVALGLLKLDEKRPFHGAECPNYPNCGGGCGLGCTHEMERPSPSLPRPPKGDAA